MTGSLAGGAKAHHFGRVSSCITLFLSASTIQQHSTLVTQKKKKKNNITHKNYKAQKIIKKNEKGNKKIKEKRSVD